MCETCSIKSNEIRRLHKIIIDKNNAIKKAVFFLMSLENDYVLLKKELKISIEASRVAKQKSFVENFPELRLTFNSPPFSLIFGYMNAIKRQPTMTTRNKIGFRYNANESAEIATNETAIEIATVISPAHAELKERIDATEGFISSKPFTTLDKKTKQYYLGTLVLFVALDTELSLKGEAAGGIQELGGNVADEPEE